MCQVFLNTHDEHDKINETVKEAVKESTGVSQETTVTFVPNFNSLKTIMQLKHERGRCYMNKTYHDSSQA